jgi:hypothetical protein
MTVDKLIYKRNTVEFVPKMTILTREQSQICICYGSESGKTKRRGHVKFVWSCR